MLNSHVPKASLQHFDTIDIKILNRFLEETAWTLHPEARLQLRQNQTAPIIDTLIALKTDGLPASFYQNRNLRKRLDTFAF